MKRSWLAFVGVLNLQLLLGLVMVVARLKGYALPCGSSLGCAASLRNSPVILGLHLTDYAALYPWLIWALLCFGIYMRQSRALKATLTFLVWFALAAAFASNSYNYIIRDEFCVYCLSYLFLSSIGAMLVGRLAIGELSSLRNSLTEIVTLTGALASVLLIAIKLDLDAANRTGTIEGIALSEVQGKHNFYIGNDRAPVQIVCFYSPICGVCRDEIGKFAALSKTNAGFGVNLRAVFDKDNRVVRDMAAALVSIATSRSSLDAASALAMSSDSQEEVFRGISPSPLDYTSVDHDSEVARAIDVRETPTCVKVQGYSAQFEPCWKVTSELNAHVSPGR